MTTSDKRPRKTSKTPKTTKAPDAAAAPGAARIETASTLPPTAGISRTEDGGAQAANTASSGTRRVRSISVSVTSRYHEDRHASIALAAYFRSESRGFAPGHEVEDWLAAEEEVDQRLLGEGRAS